MRSSKLIIRTVPVVHPCAPYREAAYKKWVPGVEIVQENPPAEYLKTHKILGSLPIQLGWASWYRLADSTGMEYLDYLALLPLEVEKVAV